MHAGYRVESFTRVDSTNLLAAEFARSGDPGRLWVVADEQMAGRARRGRNWISTAGNFYATLVLVDDFGPDQAATLGFVAGISLMEALDQLVPQSVLAAHPIQLKWPNDVLADGAKLTGMLLEYMHLGGKRNGILIGIGINVILAPAGLPYAATSLRQIGADCSPADVFRALSHAWVDNYSLWARGANLDAIRSSWLQYAAGVGQKVCITVNGVVMSGIFETIDSNCHFILRKDNGQKISIPAGDVHFGAVASAHAGS